MLCMPIKLDDDDYEIVNFREKRTVLVYDNMQNEVYQKHWHNTIEIIMPVSNTYTVTCDEKDYLLLEREILVIPAGILHNMAAQNGRRIFFLMDNTTLANNPALTGLSAFINSPVHITHKNDEALLEKLNTLIKEIYIEYNNFNAMSEMIIYIKALTLLCSIIKQKFLPDEIKSSDNHANTFEFVIKYIDKNYMYDISLDTLAKVSGYSKFYFSKIFYKYTNSTIPDYINRRRIRAAEQLLSRKNLSITDIALQTGFTSITTFNRVFKKINGCTPSEFKKLHFNNSIGDIFG